MIFRSLKEKAINKIIKKELGNAVVPGNTDKKGINTLAIIIDYDKLSDFKPLMNLASALGVDNNSVYILGHVEKVYKNVNYLIPVFASSSVKSNGTVRTPEAKEFLTRDYDLLVNYYSGAESVMHLVSVLTRASFKVGLGEANSGINDLTLMVGENDLEGFQKELVKYLRILNKL
ncbi:DUF6913 domain-containing protein [Robertkochia sediminum]|uniref:DUF6913 domain-containing protein n=1 Tax=Robertkochia sediminum TaxID=2785326 RepID=UPI0019345C71|nr:hypothetical protein [Robertkochia sediminum]MBL7473678.1 hypothetical protein [Robertkochia sediminum]